MKALALRLAGLDRIEAGRRGASPATRHAPTRIRCPPGPSTRAISPGCRRPARLGDEVEEARRDRGGPRPPMLEGDPTLGIEPDPGDRLSDRLRGGVDAAHPRRWELARQEERAVAGAAADSRTRSGRPGTWRTAAASAVRAGGGHRPDHLGFRGRWRRSQDRSKWIALAVFALIAVGAVAAILIGRSGGRRRSDRRGERLRLRAGRGAEAEEGQLQSPEADRDQGREADRGGRNQLRHLRDRARRPAGAEDRQLLRLPLRRRLLRRAHLPPGGARIRHPGRRSARQRHRRPRLQRRREAARRTSPTPKASSRWRRARRSRPGARAASSSSSSRPMPACRRNTRWSARSTRASTWSNGSASSARRAEKPKQTVLIEKISIEKR